MSGRDELARTLAETDGINMAGWEARPDRNPVKYFAIRQAEKLLAAGYRKPRTITTAEELDALAVGSVIRTSGHEDHFDPRVAVKTGFWMSESEWEVADADDFCLDSGELDDLPAIVLWEPQP